MVYYQTKKYTRRMIVKVSGKSLIKQAAEVLTLTEVFLIWQLFQ